MKTSFASEPWIFALCFATVGALSVGDARAEAFVTDESTPEEIAESLFPMFEEPEDRVVPPSEFANYRIVVDIFRKSATRPVLGAFDPSYLPNLAPNFAKSRFDSLAATEFAVVSVDGVPIKANLVSGALEAVIDQVVKVDNVKQYDPVTKKAITKKSKKTTPPGNYRLTAFAYPTKVRGADGKYGEPRTLPFPFITSTTYDRSAMFWGLHIFGGYLIHSTPHTSQLGRPASMGCVRQSFPDAMELFDLVANRSEGRRAMIRIHKMHSIDAYTRLREIFYDKNYAPTDPKYKLSPEAVARAALPNAARTTVWLADELNGSFQRIRDYVSVYGGEHSGVGYAWVDPVKKKAPKPIFPLCGGYDCFSIWGDPLKKRARDLRADAAKEARANASLPPVL